MVPMDISAYLRMAGDQTIPPLLLEVVFRSGTSYFVKNVLKVFDEAGLFAVRVWDLRALTETDHKKLISELNQFDRERWSDYRSVVPALDEANLWLRVEDVEHIVEWHDRLWPAPEEAVQEGPRKIGFRGTDVA